MARRTHPDNGNRAALKFWCGAILLAGALAGPAQAGLFDDEEARKQIVAEKKRVDDLNAQQQEINARIGKLEEALKSQALLDLFTQLEALKLEMNKLRGQLEVLNNGLENTSKRQRDMYLDLDTRMRRFEQGGPMPAPAASAPVAAPPVPPAAAGGAPGVAASASPPGAAAAATIVAANVDTGAENRVYEAAQAQRRMGNYQGAIVAFQNFIKQFPKSSLAPRAQYWIGDSHFNLREFNLAIANQQTLIKTYPDSPSVPDALLNIASSQIEANDPGNGRKTLEELVARYPISDAADKARRRLAALSVPASAGAPAAVKP